MITDNNEVMPLPVEGKAEVDPDSNYCLTCKRGFKSPQALRMHVARVHTKTIRTAGQQAVEANKPLKWSLARRRRFNAKKLQASFGLNSNKATLAQVVEHVLKYCPECGAHLEGWRK